MAAPLPEETFWMICQKPMHPNAQPSPKKRYLSYLAAKRAAIEMASNTGRDFAVLTCTDVFRPTDRLNDHGLF
ncbi:hypothetical protein ATO6_15470 [Oceanicola sp. 22II-s10i]|uniref:hypothetical protein n=1 Tax=Oceanicola sp. 22II-s10i TaxID=1317116 RepID=UPI000B524CD3|nr:hypothetical protein [Oceanicola sp. 22II-s10i]OWU83827.1 hypothetical protein ATO6_15470 [Oceanicola sp. 22II-s10i]